MPFAPTLDAVYLEGRMPFAPTLDAVYLEGRMPFAPTLDAAYLEGRMPYSLRHGCANAPTIMENLTYLTHLKTAILTINY
jgi:hypothetical protein